MELEQPRELADRRDREEPRGPHDGASIAQPGRYDVPDPYQPRGDEAEKRQQWPGVGSDGPKDHGD